MPTRPIAIIFNPSARSEKAAHILNQLQPLTQAQADIFITQTIGDALPLAKKAAQEGYNIIVAAGGDGTLNEVINGVFPSPIPNGEAGCVARTAKKTAAIDSVFRSKVAIIQIDLEGIGRLPSCSELDAFGGGDEGSRFSAKGLSKKRGASSLNFFAGD